MQSRNKASCIPKAVRRNRGPLRHEAQDETPQCLEEDTEISPVEFHGDRRQGVINPDSSMDIKPPPKTPKVDPEGTHKGGKRVMFDLAPAQPQSGKFPKNALASDDALMESYVPNIFTDLPDSTQESKSEKEAVKTIRLIVRRAYRNASTGQLYAHAEGRRLIIVRNDIPLTTLRDECSKALKIKEVQEVLMHENDFVSPVVQTKFLCNFDEIVAITDPPERVYSFPCCLKFLDALNLGHPDHKPLFNKDTSDPESLKVTSRSASRIAIMVQQLNRSKAVTEKGSQEVRKMSQGWARVSGKLLSSSRPFYVYAWKSALKVDLQVMLRLTGFSLTVGLLLACLPFNANTDVHGYNDHALYAYFGMGILGVQTGLFVNAWIGYYFYVHMSILSYLFSALFAPFISIALYFGLSAIYFPFYNTPICIMLLLTIFVYLMAYPHMPYRLKSKSEVKKDIGNSLLILDFFMLVFVVNRLLVLNFGRRDTTSLIVLSVIYPLLVSRSKTDCSRLAEAFNRKSVAVVEAFFTFVSSIFQMIVFLSINSKVNPLYVFILINTTDIGCLIAGGPVAAFFQQSNAQILKEHRDTVDNDPFNEALGVFVKWVKDPFQMRPLLIKCYSEVSAKLTFIILALVIRWGPSGHAYPFIQGVDQKGFMDAIYFTASELVMWLIIQYSVEIFLRRQRCQYLLQKEKKNMLCIANILGLINAFITTLLLLQQTPVSGA